MVTMINSPSPENYSCDFNTQDCGTVHNVTLTTKISLGVTLSIIVVMTIFGNILVLLAVILNRKLRTATNYFVISLATADLLLGVLVLPFSTILQLEKQWILGSFLCDLWASTDVLCCTASILSLCAISIDRYIGVTRPLQHRTIMTRRRAIYIIACLWLASLVISIGPVIGWRDPQRSPTSCHVTIKPAYVIFSTLGSFYIPSIVITAIYCRIYQEAKIQVNFLKTGFKKAKLLKSQLPSTEDRPVTLRAVSRRNLNAHKDSKDLRDRANEQSSVDPLLQPTENSTKANLEYGHTNTNIKKLSTEQMFCDKPKPTGSNKLKILGKQLIIGSKIAKFNNEKRAAKTLGIVVGVFFVCWFPFFIILPLGSLCEVCRIPSVIFDVVFWLGYCNSLLNPIIYATWNKEFKRTFIRILKFQCQYINRNNKSSAITYLAKNSTTGLKADS